MNKMRVIKSMSGIEMDVSHADRVLIEIGYVRVNDLMYNSEGHKIVGLENAVKIVAALKAEGFTIIREQL